MSDNIAVALISASSAVIVSVTALVLNNKRFNDMSKRLDRIEHTLELIQADLKEFYRDITRLKERAGLQ